MVWMITGGCGFVGSNVADDVLTSGGDAIVVDSLSRLGARENLAWLRRRHGDDWRFIEADTRNQAVMDKVIGENQPEVIAHLAGQVAMTTSLVDPRLDFETNVVGTFNVLDAVRRLSPASIVLYSSSNKVYGTLDNVGLQEGETRYRSTLYPLGFTEDLPLEGSTPYGCSKLAADQYVRDYFRVYQVRTVVFRHSSMYGGRQFASYDQGWVGWFCQKAWESKFTNSATFTISGNGKQVRDLLHADDVVRAYKQAVEQIDRTSGQIYNIGGGIENSLSLLELFRELERLVDVRLRYTPIEWRHGDQKVFVADFSKARGDFSFAPRVDRAEGLSRMVEWTKDVLKGLKAAGTPQ